MSMSRYDDSREIDVDVAIIAVIQESGSEGPRINEVVVVGGVVDREGAGDQPARVGNPSSPSNGLPYLAGHSWNLAQYTRTNVGDRQFRRRIVEPRVCLEEERQLLAIRREGPSYVESIGKWTVQSGTHSGARIGHQQRTALVRLARARYPGQQAVGRASWRVRTDEALIRTEADDGPGVRIPDRSSGRRLPGLALCGLHHNSIRHRYGIRKSTACVEIPAGGYGDGSLGAARAKGDLQQGGLRLDDEEVPCIGGWEDRLTLSQARHKAGGKVELVD